MGLLNKELAEHAKNQNWGLLRNTKFEMAEILRKQSKLKDALGMYFEVCYLDLNGPNNVGNITDPDILKEFPPWNPKDGAFLAPGIIDRIVRILKKSNSDSSTAEQLFQARATKLKQSLRLPVSVPKAWQQLQAELFKD